MQGRQLSPIRMKLDQIWYGDRSHLIWSGVLPQWLFDSALNSEVTRAWATSIHHTDFIHLHLISTSLHCAFIHLQMIPSQENQERFCLIFQLGLVISHLHQIPHREESASVVCTIGVNYSRLEAFCIPEFAMASVMDWFDLSALYGGRC